MVTHQLIVSKFPHLIIVERAHSGATPTTAGEGLDKNWFIYFANSCILIR